MSPASPTASNSGWKVDSQTPISFLGPDGKAATGMRINFTTAKGVSAHVDVAWRDYSPDNVRARVSELVAKIDAVHALTGP